MISQAPNESFKRESGVGGLHHNIKYGSFYLNEAGKLSSAIAANNRSIMTTPMPASPNLLSPMQVSREEFLKWVEENLI